MGAIARRIMTANNRVTAEDAVKRLSIAPGETFVELGPGSGWGLRAALAFLPGRVVAVEISEQFRNELAASEIADQIDLRSDDARDLGFLQDQSVQRLLALNVVYFLDPLVDYAREFQRILHPQGVALMACKPDLIRNVDGGVFVNVEMAAIEQAFAAVGLHTRSEFIDLGHPRKSYVALWLTANPTE